MLGESTEVIEIDIGGTSRITTLKKTVTKVLYLIKYPNSALATLFSGKYNILTHNDRVFIDRESKPFIGMINYLRTGKAPYFMDKKSECNFNDELDFWGVPNIESKKSSRNKIIKFDSEWCASTLTLSESNTTLKKDSIRIK